MNIRIAILDMNDGLPNQGMRCLREIIAQWSMDQNVDVTLEEFEVRRLLQLPDLSYDIYISSGGPGSPLESENSEWENKYFDWIKEVENWNSQPGNHPRKNVFFICHSFQLACRYFNIADVCKRNSTAFGIFPVHMLKDGSKEPVFDGLRDPFYAVDSRDYQVVKPNHERLKKLGGKILTIEKNRPHVPYERAVMAVRFTPHFIGTQFHPEADATGMSMYLQREDKKTVIINSHGRDKWSSMIDHLNDPDKITWTHNHVLPNFLTMSVAELQ
ncbi:GMP synthase [Danxiaibacter flavus]|uniref:GMP synthase n=1 Tax=Danxiaibacter flavus TaxID=3049108 RepID=A0ABV3ZHS3_9BACT|nr:GMP synthase [Chitinophagaceae bacterium DXS]